MIWVKWAIVVGGWLAYGLLVFLIHWFIGISDEPGNSGREMRRKVLAGRKKKEVEKLRALVKEHGLDMVVADDGRLLSKDEWLYEEWKRRGISVEPVRMSAGVDAKQKEELLDDIKQEAARRVRA